ncbi:MAG: DUF4281 domain-containing protein [Acidobacteria bacterium]|nr:DUF4281 domain-containing protein [Acidobacteriota bacterium]
MQAETIFSIANTLALVSWLLLAILPRFRVTRAVVLTGTVPLLLSAAYLVIIVMFFGTSEGSFSSLAGVMQLFTNPWTVLAGWLHYLAFDLFVGAWEVRDAEKHGVPHLLVIPCLFFTFMLGPIGYLMYVAIRGVVKLRGKNAEAAI